MLVETRFERAKVELGMTSAGSVDSGVGMSVLGGRVDGLLCKDGWRAKIAASSAGPNSTSLSSSTFSS